MLRLGGRSLPRVHKVLALISTEPSVSSAVTRRWGRATASPRAVADTVFMPVRKQVLSTPPGREFHQSLRSPPCAQTKRSSGVTSSARARTTSILCMLGYLSAFAAEDQRHRNLPRVRVQQRLLDRRHDLFQPIHE